MLLLIFFSSLSSFSASNKINIDIKNAPKKRKNRIVSITTMSNSAADTPPAGTSLLLVGPLLFEQARSDAIVAHCQHFGLHTDCPFIEIIARDDPQTAMFVEYLSQNGIPFRSEQFRLCNSTHELTYMVQVQYKPNIFIKTIPTTFTLPIPSDSLAHTWPPVVCTERDCPIEKYHYQGLYMYYGRPSSEMSRFGFSDPPPEVWQALKRVQDKLPETGDKEMVDRFADYHAWLLTRAGETGIEQEDEEDQDQDQEEESAQ